MVNKVCEWEPTFLDLSLLASTMVMPVSNGRILIIAIDVYVMRCNFEEQQTSYSRHSFEWIGVEECINIQWEESHSFPIDWGWHGQSTHCATVDDLHHARYHTADSNCISLQDHRQQRILMARSRPILILPDASVALQLTKLTSTSKYLCSTCGWSLLLRRSKWTNSSPKRHNLLKELSSGTEESSFPCQLTWLSAQFSAFAQTRRWFVCSSLPWFYCAPWSAFGLPRILSFSHSASLSLCMAACCCSKRNSRRRFLFMLVLSYSDPQHLNRHMVGCGCHEILIPCSTAVLFSTTFLLISISRVEGESKGEFI